VDFKEIITLVIAIWGAVISTLLAIREIKKENRNIKIILYYVYWMEKHKISITNINQRPITIVEINLSIRNVALERRSAFFSHENGYVPPEFPVTLTDGQTVEFDLSPYITDHLSNPKVKLRIKVYDAEGKVYTKYEKAVHDIKQGWILPKK